MFLSLDFVDSILIGVLQYTPTQNLSQNAQYAYGATGQSQQPAYDTSRAWLQPNPEVHRVINDPYLSSTYQSAGTTGTQSYTISPYQYAVAYTDRHLSAFSRQPSSYSGSSNGLTADQLYTFNYSQQPSNRTDVWKGESQRDGSWYGSVEKK